MTLFIKNPFGRLWRKPPRQPEMPAICPDKPLAVIGDIHGRADLLRDLLVSIPSDHQIICVGDYVDRGEQSAEVIRILRSRPDILCLMGNHEDMFLQFLDTPDRSGDRWLRYGGLQTLQSFGVPIEYDQAAAKRFVECRDALLAAMGPDAVEWLRGLPVWWSSGNVGVVHAAADPTRALTDQERSILCWGHPEFLTQPRQDGIWIVHGHTIVDKAHADHGRIAVDTGGYATGRLSAALVAPGHIEFIST